MFSLFYSNNMSLSFCLNGHYSKFKSIIELVASALTCKNHSLLIGTLLTT